MERGTGRWGNYWVLSCCCCTKLVVEGRVAVAVVVAVAVAVALAVTVAESYTRVEGMAMRTKDTDSCRHRN